MFDFPVKAAGCVCNGTAQTPTKHVTDPPTRLGVILSGIGAGPEETYGFFFLSDCGENEEAINKILKCFLGSFAFTYEKIPIFSLLFSCPGTKGATPQY